MGQQRHVCQQAGVLEAARGVAARRDNVVVGGEGGEEAGRGGVARRGHGGHGKGADLGAERGEATRGAWDGAEQASE